jgi:hypothetical protein
METQSITPPPVCKKRKADTDSTDQMDLPSLPKRKKIKAGTTKKNNYHGTFRREMALSPTISDLEAEQRVPSWRGQKHAMEEAVPESEEEPVSESEKEVVSAPKEQLCLPPHHLAQLPTCRISSEQQAVQDLYPNASKDQSWIATRATQLSSPPPPPPLDLHHSSFHLLSPIVLATPLTSHQPSKTHMTPPASLMWPDPYEIEGFDHNGWTATQNMSLSPFSHASRSASAVALETDELVAPPLDLSIDRNDLQLDTSPKSQQHHTVTLENTGLATEEWPSMTSAPRPKNHPKYPTSIKKPNTDLGEKAVDPQNFDHGTFVVRSPSKHSQTSTFSYSSIDSQLSSSSASENLLNPRLWWEMFLLNKKAIVNAWRKHKNNKSSLESDLQPLCRWLVSAGAFTSKDTQALKDVIITWVGLHCLLSFFHLNSPGAGST